MSVVEKVIKTTGYRCMPVPALTVLQPLPVSTRQDAGDRHATGIILEQCRNVSNICTYPLRTAKYKLD